LPTDELALELESEQRDELAAFPHEENPLGSANTQLVGIEN
jgi:hypothetical protein